MSDTALGSVDDRRAAVGISVQLSGQLISGALAVLGIVGAFVTYVMGSRQPHAGFYFFAITSALLLVASIFIAGKAITAARNAGFEGGWNLQAGKSGFNWQAIAILASLLTLSISVALSGPSSVSALDKRLQENERRLDEIADRQKRLETALIQTEKAFSVTIDRLNTDTASIGETLRKYGGEMRDLQSRQNLRRRPRRTQK